MDPHRKLWNSQQQALRAALNHPADHLHAIELFLAQHAMLHAAEISGSGLYSFDEELWQGLSEEVARTIPCGEEHSIVWNLWHLARIEDVTMNILIADEKQIYQLEGWMENLQLPFCEVGNALNPTEIATLSATINIPALRAYRSAVGLRTRKLVQRLQAEDFKHKTPPERLERTRSEGAVPDAARGLLDYWGGLTVAGLLLMPPTRHNLVHLNEAIRLKKKFKPSA